MIETGGYKPALVPQPRLWWGCYATRQQRTAFTTDQFAATKAPLLWALFATSHPRMSPHSVGHSTATHGLSAAKPKSWQAQVLRPLSPARSSICASFFPVLFSQLLHEGQHTHWDNLYNACTPKAHDSWGCVGVLLSFQRSNTDWLLQDEQPPLKTWSSFLVLKAEPVTAQTKLPNKMHTLTPQMRCCDPEKASLSLTTHCKTLLPLSSPPIPTLRSLWHQSTAAKQKPMLREGQQMRDWL